MDLKQLRYFTVVADSKSLTKAAAQLLLSQPALTRQIQGLEEDLGVELFVRHSRGLDLTAAGALLLERTGRIMAELDQIRRDVGAFKDEVISPLRIGISSGAAEMLLPPVISELRRRNPNVDIIIRELDAAGSLRALRAGELDIVVTSYTGRIQGAYAVPLIKDTFVIASAPSSWLGEEIDAKELLRLPLVCVGSRDNFLDFVAKVFGSRAVDPHPLLEVNGYSALKSLLKNGGFYTVLSENGVLDEVNRGELAMTRIKGLPLQLKIYVACRKDFQASMTMRTFIAAARKQTADLVAANHWRGEILR